MERITDTPAQQARRPSPDSEWQTTKPKTIYIMSNDPAVQGHNPPDPVPCEYCGKLRYTEGYFLLGKIMWNLSGPKHCDCPEAMAAYEKEKAEREAKERAKQQAEAEVKEDKPEYHLGNIISKICAIHPSYNLLNIYGLTVFQLYDSFFQLGYMRSTDLSEKIFSNHGGDSFKFENWLQPILKNV